MQILPIMDTVMIKDSYHMRTIVENMNWMKPTHLYRSLQAASSPGERIIIFFEKITSHKTEFLNFCFLAKNQ